MRGGIGSVGRACGSLAHVVFLRTDAALVTLSRGMPACTLIRRLETNRDRAMRRLMLLRHAKTETRRALGPRSGPPAGRAWPQGCRRDRRLDRPAPALSRSRCWFRTAVRAHQTWDIAWEAMKDLRPAAAAGRTARRNSTAPTRRSCWKSSAWHPATDPEAADAGRPQSRHARTGAGACRQRRRRRRRKALDRQSADLGPCRIRLCDRRLGATWRSAAAQLVQFVSPKLLKQTSGD